MAPQDPDPGMFWLSSPPQRSPSRMSFRSRAVPRQTLVVLALIVCSACGVFESQERVPRRRTERARFPVRRIGRGIPLGETGLPPELFHPPNTGAILARPWTRWVRSRRLAGGRHA
jgi:hypothetical protein